MAGASPSVVSVVPGRRVTMFCSADAVIQGAISRSRVIALAISVFMVDSPLHLDDFDGAFLVIRLFRDWIDGIQRDLVDQLAGVEPGDEDETDRRLVAATGFDPGTDFTAPGYDAHFITAAHTTFAGIVGMHEHHRIGEGFVEFRHALGHRAGMPMLQYPAGAQPHVEFFIR